MSFELEEANRKIKQLEVQLSQKNEQLAEYRDIINNGEKTTMWLCGYVMELHNFRNGILKVNLETRSLDSVMDYVKEKFPQLQHLSIQKQFEHFGSQVKIKEIQNEVSSTMNRLREKTNFNKENNR